MKHNDSIHRQRIRRPQSCVFANGPPATTAPQPDSVPHGHTEPTIPGPVSAVPARSGTTIRSKST